MNKGNDVSMFLVLWLKIAVNWFDLVSDMYGPMSQTWASGFPLAFDKYPVVVNPNNTQHIPKTHARVIFGPNTKKIYKVLLFTWESNVS